MKDHKLSAHVCMPYFLALDWIQLIYEEQVYVYTIDFDFIIASSQGIMKSRGSLEVCPVQNLENNSRFYCSFRSYSEDKIKRSYFKFWRTIKNPQTLLKLYLKNEKFY